MDIVEFFTDQLEREAAISRRVLAQMPEGRNAWKPHEKSMEFGYLAALVAQMPAWIAMIVTTDGLDFSDTESSRKFQPRAADSTSALLALADESHANGDAALAGTTEDHLNGIWSFKMAGRVLSGGPRYQQIADVFTHLAHHRGQLTVYLRLNDAKVPSLYGPSADEKVV